MINQIKPRKPGNDRIEHPDAVINQTQQLIEGAWITKSEALAVLNKSERSLDRLVTARKIQRLKRQRDGMAPEPLYNRADIDRLMAHPAYPVPQADASSGDNRISAPDPAHMMAQLALGVLQAQAAQGASPAALSAPPKWLTLESAAGYCGLSVVLLRNLIKARKLRAFRDGCRWKIRREDIDSLEAPFAESKRKLRLPTLRKSKGAASVSVANVPLSHSNGSRP